jgi:hypothetical protein
LAPRPGFRYSVIVSPAVSKEEFEQLLLFAGQVEMIETHLPATDTTSARCSEQLRHLQSRLNESGLRDVQLFVEADAGASAAVLAASLAAFNTDHRGEKVISNAGYKLRCGGQTKQAFPTAREAAEVITICREHDIPIKFTAGMHQPLCQYSSELQVNQHGFINVFTAALLSWSCSLELQEIAACLRDQAADHFTFTRENFSWLDHTISAGEIARLRRNRVISFGSCSFTEPVAGLRALGLLGTTGA